MGRPAKARQNRVKQTKTNRNGQVLGSWFFVPVPSCLRSTGPCAEVNQTGSNQFPHFSRLVDEREYPIPAGIAETLDGPNQTGSNQKSALTPDRELRVAVKGRKNRKMNPLQRIDARLGARPSGDQGVLHSLVSFASLALLCGYSSRFLR
jgi:hypothetical protein